MKKDKLAKWLDTRSELLVSGKINNSLLPFLSKRHLDSQTSQDLLIADYFNSIDRAITTPGRHTLYAILNAPLTTENQITDRRNFMKKLSSNNDLRDKLKKLLWKVRFSPVHSVNAVLFENMSSLFTREKLVLLLLCFVFMVVAIPLLYSQIAIYTILLFFIISFLIFARNLSIYNTHIPGLTRLASHYYTAQKIIKLFNEYDIHDDHIEKLAASLPEISSILPSLNILRYGSFTSGDALQLLLFWIKNIFCLDLIAYNKAVNIISQNRKAFINFYSCYGMIDALLTVSLKIASEQEKICTAEFDHNQILSAEKTYHPLVTDAVSNSIEIKKGVILTGSNMAGKSTFLRTIGLNAVLAQTLGFCYARKFRLPFLNVVSIINKNDNLHLGESFYFYEASRISEMIKRQDNQPYLFLIDELLSGTNSLERISASIPIIRYLLHIEKIISMVATHDVSIAETLKEECGCFYFSDIIEDDNMRFDYKLRDGIIKTTNAIRMLKILGLPSSIVEEAVAYSKQENLIAAVYPDADQ